MVFKDFGSVTVFKAVQSSNASSAMVSTPSPIFALVSAVHHELTERRANRQERVAARKCVKPQVMNRPMKKSPAMIEAVCFAIVGSCDADMGSAYVREIDGGSIHRLIGTI